MKKYLYIACITLMQMLLGYSVAKTPYSVLFAFPIGLLTGFLFALLGREYKNE